LDKVHILTEETAALKKYLWILQGQDFTEKREEAERFLSNKGLNLETAVMLVNNMNEESFTVSLVTLSQGGAVRTRYESIVNWVEKFGLESQFIADIGMWEIFCGLQENRQDTHFEDYEDYHGHSIIGWIKRHMIITGAIIVFVIIFFAIWLVTGDLWAALEIGLYIFEIIIDVLADLDM